APREAGGTTPAPLPDGLAPRPRGLRAHRRRARDLEQDVVRRVARRANGEPAHHAEGHVGADLEAELADVEVESLLLVEDEDVRDVDRVEHRLFLLGIHDSMLLAVFRPR